MLYPIRIDISTKDSALRIIDTILVDPTCLPVPPPTTNYNTNDLQTQTIILNAEHFTQTLLADMEVEGMTNKSAKIGRLRLLENTLLKQLVQAQFQKQLKAVLDQELRLRKRYHAAILTKKMTKKRKLDSNPVDGECKEGGMDIKAKKEESKSQSQLQKSNLIPIHLRIKENGICIMDQFKVDVDPLHPHLSNPILLASSIAQDMNLSPDMINSLAISIAEQIHGLKVSEDVQGLTTTERNKNDGPSTSSNSGLKRMQVNKAIPMAWKMEDKDEVIAKNCHGNTGKPNFELNA